MKSEDLIELYMKANLGLINQKIKLKLILEKRDRDLTRNFQEKELDVADLRDDNQSLGDL